MDSIEVEGCHRWLIYHRLRELGIVCSCQAYQPLKVRIDTAIALVQFWSVVQQMTTPRQTRIDWLEACWKCR